MMIRHIADKRVFLLMGGWAWLLASADAGALPPVTSRTERLRFEPETGAWSQLARPEPGTDIGDLAAARSEFTKGHYKKARKKIKRWLKSYGTSSRLLPQAILLQAQTEKALRNYYKAREILRQLTEEYNGTAEVQEGLAELFNIAEVFLSGTRRKVWGFRILKADEVGLDILDDIAVRFPESALAEQAVRRKADYYFDQGDFDLAELEYTRLVQMFPRSRFVRYAMRRSADAALASFAGIAFDDAPLIEAEERYRIYADQYRDDANREQIGLILASIREKRSSKEYEIGAYYERTEHPRAAAVYYRSVLTNWPETIAASRANSALQRVAPDGSGAATSASALVPAAMEVPAVTDPHEEEVEG